jgi:beta-N-acetylhexosaminidase
MLTTAKHFPGHGDTDVDSHLTLARVNATAERLDQLELVPFRDAIAAGVDSIMTAHVTVPALEPDPNRPASVSSNVITGLLKEKLGFHGLVVTDALDMGALTRVFPGNPSQVSGEEAVAAIQAGNDMVIIPSDLDGAYNGLLNAVKQGTIPQTVIDACVLKILRLKASVGLDRNRLVNLAEVEHVIAQPESLTFAQTVADRSITLVSDANTLLPLRTSETPTSIVAVIFTDDARSSDGVRTFARQLRQRVPGATVLYVDQANAAFIGPDVLSAVAGAHTVIALAEAVPSARRTTNGQGGGSADLSQDGAQLLANIVKTAANKTVVAAFGNPYVGTQIPGVQTYICTFSNSSDSAVSLVRALFGEIPIRGRSPVTLPGMAQRGAGLDR